MVGGVRLGTPHLYVGRMPPVPAQSTRKVLTVDGFVAHRTVKRTVRLLRAKKNRHGKQGMRGMAECIRCSLVPHNACHPVHMLTSYLVIKVSIGHLINVRLVYLPQFLYRISR